MKKSIRLSKKYSIVFMISFLAVVVIYQPIAKMKMKESMPLAINGVLDLSNWDFQKKGLVKLDGQWIYYDNQLLYPNEINEELKGEFQQVPSYVKGRGSGTYYLKIKLPTSNSLFGIKTEKIRTANSLYVNGQKIGRSGQISKGERKGHPGITPYTEYFHVDADSLELVVQVENNVFVNKGIGQSIYFGEPKAITLLNNVKFSINFGLSIMLLLFSIYVSVK